MTRLLKVFQILGISLKSENLNAICKNLYVNFFNSVVQE